MSDFFKDSDINSIIEGFQIFGSETNGLINPNELKEIMESMNMEENNPFLYNVIEKLSLDPEIQEKGGIEAEDFILKLEEELDDISSLEGQNKLFSIFCDPITNKIPITAFAQIAKNVGEEENEEKIKNLIAKSQISDKELNFEEFNEVINSEKEFLNKYDNNFVYKKSSFSENNHNDINKNKHVLFNNKKNKNKNRNKKNNNKKQILTYDNNKYNINKEITPEKNKINIYNTYDYNDIDNNDDYIFIEDNEYENIDYDNDINNFDNINYNNEINNDINNFDNIKKNDYKNKNEIIPKITYDSIGLENKESEENETDEINHKSKTQKYNNAKKREEYDLDIDIDNDNIGEFERTIKKRHTKGRIEEDEIEEIHNNINDINLNLNNDENNDEINDLKSSKRYHRRYRDIKSNTHDKKDEKIIKSRKNNNNNNKGSSTIENSKYWGNNK